MNQHARHHARHSRDGFKHDSAVAIALGEKVISKEA
jgi:hypothetical protein